MSFEHDPTTDHDDQVNDAPKVSAVDQALSAVQTAADVVENGPSKIDKNLAKLKESVTEYQRSYDVLHVLGAAGSTTPPGRIPGVRAVNSLKHKKKSK